MDNDPQPVQEQNKEKSLNQLLTSAIVDIYVGPESSHWPLHERLLCYHSPFLANIFYNDQDNKSSSKNKSYGFPDEEDQTFTLLVGWLYSNSVPPPKLEKDVGPLLDLYLLAQHLQINRLLTDVVDATREFYHTSSTYPGLRRVQYIYANTDEDNEMREMMVSCVARQLTTTEQIPLHWANALKRDGQLAVDIIRSIQRWNIEERSIPDVRNSSISSGGRSRKDKMGFSAVVREADSMDTDATGMTGSMTSNLGVESLASEETGHADDKGSHSAESTPRSVSVVGKEIGVEAQNLNLTSLSLLQAQLKRPPNPSYQLDTPSSDPTFTLKLNSPSAPIKLPRRRHRNSSVTFKPVAEVVSVSRPVREGEELIEELRGREAFTGALRFVHRHRDWLFLGALWLLYLIYLTWLVLGSWWDGRGEGRT